MKRVKDFVQVGNNIQRCLNDRGITQQSLADDLDISKQVMNKIIKGSKVINVSEMARIASVLGTSTDELLAAPDEPDSNSADMISFIGIIKDDETQKKVKLIRTSIDEIHMLEELLYA